MSSIWKHIHIITCSLLLGFSALESAEGQLLSLSAYLCQVQESHEGLIAAFQAAEAASDRADEGEMLFRPTLFANARHLRNQLPSFASDGDDVGVQQNDWELGLTQQMRTGSQITLLGSGDHVSSMDGGSTIYSLKLNQPLWRNWLARETKAQADLIRSSALSTSFSKLYQAQVALVQAELLYWQLVICREAISLQGAALERAEVLHEWQMKRNEKNLANDSDLLQADASMKRYKLEVQAAINQERRVASQFNSFRGICSDVVEEQLVSLEEVHIEQLSPPCRTQVRTDILGAEHALDAFKAETEAAIQSSYSKVDFFVSAAHKDIRYTPILTDSAIDPTRPEFAVGIQISIPLGFGLPSRVRDARRSEAEAAELELSRKSFEADQEWNDLVKRLDEEKLQLELSRSIEDAQRQKYEVEKERFTLGKSNTYTVISFEQDYMMAQHSTIQRLYNLFEVYTRLKLFRSTCESS